ncbi:Unknown protein sequence [Pseudomonas syringae pv. atrofaciens]|nr:Unknown protein sequence [Pseudomonas syringae pv. atrofaciens]KPZ00230.1 Unknown protein sequence [Pseudomonas syringae pv. aptata]RMN67034.1 hypothetical protein ALQ54_05157 [Pseudomonas syringae]
MSRVNDNTVQVYAYSAIPLAHKKTRRSGSFFYQYHSDILSVAVPAMVIILDLRSASCATVDGYRLLLREHVVQG